MTLTASTSVAASRAAYFPDNFTAWLQQGGSLTAVNTGYAAPAGEVFQAWKDLNKTKQFFISGTTGQLGEAKAGDAIPDGSLPVDLDVAYGLKTGQVRAADYLMKPIADAFRRATAGVSFGTALSRAPEANLSFDVSQLSTEGLHALLKLFRAQGADNKREVEMGTTQDQLNKIAQLGMTRETLTKALELQSSFSIALAADLAITDEDGKPVVTPEEAARLNLVQDVLTSLVGQLSSENEAERLALAATPAGQATPKQVAATVAAAASALTAELSRAADLALMMNDVIKSFGSSLDIQQTDDGFVVKTNVAQSRDAQIAAVRAELEGALKDPGLRTALADALTGQADALGTADMSRPDLTGLNEQVAQAVIDALLTDPALLDQLAAKSVDDFHRISQMALNEAISASARDTTIANA